MGAREWSVVRRILDGRRQFIIADGGIKAEISGYAENAAHAVLLAVDKPEESAGEEFFFADENIYTIRQRIEFIANYMNHDWELVDMPYDLAVPCHPFWRHWRENTLRDTRKIRDRLGYRDVVSPEEALRRTVDWLVGNPLNEEGERQLGDPFDYMLEDKITSAWHALRENFPDFGYPVEPYAHIYRHPKRPGDEWRRAEDDAQ